MTTDPFERHQLQHLSPSSLRLFRDAPAVWIGKYMLKAPDEVGPGAWRGTAVEAGLDHLLFGASPEVALQATYDKWNELALGLIEPDVVKEQDALADFLVQAGVAFGGRPVPLQRQGKVELKIPGISVPLIGYADYVWPDMGADLKTTWRLPGSHPDPNHVSQVTAYSLYYDRPFELIYASPRKWVRHDVTPDMMTEAYDRIVETCHAIRSLLARVENGIDALSMFPIIDNFYLRPAMATALRAAKAAVVVPGEVRPPTFKLVS